jgi:hypothetical protein
MRTVTNVDELDVAIARALSAALESRGIRRADFAREMSELGFRWSGNTVSQVVTSRRGLSLLEVAGVCAALQRPLGDLLDGKRGRQVDLPSGSVSVDDVVSALTRGRSAWQAHRRGELTSEDEALYEQLFPPEYDEAAAKAARRLGVAAATVVDASTALWGHELGRERDRRVTADPQESRRSLQARRGHVTRALIEEIRAHLGMGNGEPQ